MSSAAPRSALLRDSGVLILAACALLWSCDTGAEAVAPLGSIDRRVRNVDYDPGEVYRLRGYVGYQIDLEFAPGESFAGIGAGDIEALSFAGTANHLFLKPKVPKVATNITVLTTRRSYQFAYTAAVMGESTDPDEVRPSTPSPPPASRT